LLLLALAPALGGAALAACGSSSGGSTPAGDGGTDGGATFSYAPQGCAYTVSPPDTRGFTDLALDDAKAAGDAPIRVRIGLGGGTSKGKAGYADPTTSAVFTWETAATTTAAKVRLGGDPNSLSDVHAGYSWQTPPPTVGLGNNEPPAQMHEVHVCGLTPGKTYYYQVGGGSPEQWSATQSFTTVPSSGAIKIGVSGDSRDSADVLQLVQLRMRDAGVALQLFSGDFVLVGTQESLFAKWLDKMWKDPADSSKFLTLGQQMFLMAPGNHEHDLSQFFGNFALPGDGPYAETYASFDVGSAHVVVLDDEQIAVGQGDPPAAQLAWLDADLAAAEADRAAHPFIIVVHHRGELSTATHGKDSDVAAARNALMPIWDKHHVDLVLNGHDHNYERSKPVTGPASAPTVQASATMGTTYVVCAGAGAGAYAPGSGTVDYRAFNAGFGQYDNKYVGVYSILTLEQKKLTLQAYGLKQACGGVGGDDLIDTFTTMR